MSTLIIELPERLTDEINRHNISKEQVYRFIVQAIEVWLRTAPEAMSEGDAHETRSRFSESAVPFIEKLIQENRQLFERLAEL